MFSQLRPAIVILTLLAVLTGVVYPALVTGIAQVFFSHQANGSPIFEDDRLAGSELIGQSFSNAGYFWGRPSATAFFPYNAAASGGSNLGPLNPALEAAVQERVEGLRLADPQNADPIPVDLVTASGSGLDPHISVAAADYQIPRVVRERGISEAELRGLVDEHTKGRQLGFLGEPRVNVLELNLALDRVYPIDADGIE
jgi:potassium-transporting ATPase KdpC subunit